MRITVPRSLALAAVAVAAVSIGVETSVATATATAGHGVRFSATYVSRTLGGGEPFVIYSHQGKDLIFSSHESTTLTDRTYLGTPGSSCDFSDPTAPSGFLCSYHNQVNAWYSTDAGRTWKLSSENPLATGFSDPSLTEDASGRIYDTGIDLANDALFSSTNGGRSFPTGTPQCHDGDRPWLAGGKRNEVFLSTDTEDPNTGPTGHEVFHSTNGGASCQNNGIIDNGSFGKTGSYSGFGQLYYNHRNGSLVEPADFMNSDGAVDGVGISALPNASKAFSSSSAKFTPHAATLKTTEIDHWPAIAIDSGNTTYVVWSTDPRDKNSTKGCSTSVPNATGGPMLQANSVMLAYTRNGGRSWSKPFLVAHPGTTVLWPWITAGSAGRVGIVWYQANQLTDPDCDSAALNGKPATRWTVRAAVLTAATSPASYPVSSVNAVPVSKTHPGGVLHVGGICQGGTTCLATGQDRRLGDYFTDATDGDGCLMIATGDTMLTDSVTGGGFAQSRPLFVHQVSGPSLTAGRTCALATAKRRIPGSSHQSSHGSGITPGQSRGGGTTTTTTSGSTLPNTGLNPPLPAVALGLLFAAASGVALRRRQR